MTRRFPVLLILVFLAGIVLAACDRAPTGPAAACPNGEVLRTFRDTARTVSGYIVSIADFRTCGIDLTVKDSVGP